jgi:acetyltransferase-like isoleucine patch superfamily enzyme
MRQSGRDKFRKFKGLITVLVKVNSIVPKKINHFFLRFFRNTNGKIGLVIRYVLVKNLAKSCGDNVSIHPNVFLFSIDKMSFGNNISIHPMCYLDAAGELVIGDNVSVAHNCSIMTNNHSWDDISVPIKYNPEVNGKVTIEEDIWLGCGVRVLAGVTLQARTVVAAGAVVNKSGPGHAVYGGVPAKLIKRINE